MTNSEFGDIVLVPFPFTDQSAIKKRPAVVINARGFGDQRPDLIIMAISSQVRPSPAVGEFTIRHWKAAGLLKPSVVKPVITTIEKRLVLRRLGKLQAIDQAELRRTLDEILG